LTTYYHSLKKMNSIHFRNLFDTLSSTIISVIKEKIAHYNIQTLNTEKSIIILKPSRERYIETKRVKMLSSELILLEDNTPLVWEEIKNFIDLLSILEFVEEWSKMKANESFQIEWNICDFEDRASEIEESTNGENIPLFDRSKFPFALKILEDHHDCNLGISWDDVDDHLNNYCRFK
jgi:hypothetical protein